jgi:c-di-GMP-binding flagellar brake protein YcgR
MIRQSQQMPQAKARLPETTVERRLYHRVRVRWPTTLVTRQGAIDGITRNLSLGGVFLYYNHADPQALPLRKHDQVDIVLKIPGHDHIQASAVVKWSDILALEETGTILGVGLEFVEIRPEDREYLLEVIAEKMYWSKGDAA